MKVFLCYAREDVDLVESIAIRLRGAGHDVFFDRAKLEPGSDFDHRILARSDLLVFFASPAALRDDAYARTELEIFKRRFPQPQDRVLTVGRPGTDLRALPSYLGAVSAFEPKGDPTAHVTAAALEVLQKLGRPRRRALAVTLAALGVVACGVLLWMAGAFAGEGHFRVTTASLSELKDSSPKNQGEFVVKAEFSSDTLPGKDAIDVEFDRTSLLSRTVEVLFPDTAGPGRHSLVSFINIVDTTDSRQILRLQQLEDVRWRLACALDGQDRPPRRSEWQPVGSLVFAPANLVVLPEGSAAAAELKANLGGLHAVLLVLGDGESQAAAVRRAGLLATESQRVVWCKQPLDIVDELRRLWAGRTLNGEIPTAIACTITRDGQLADVIPAGRKVTGPDIMTALAKADAR
jgi:hypothetical protein